MSDMRNILNKVYHNFASLNDLDVVRHSFEKFVATLESRYVYDANLLISVSRKDLEHRIDDAGRLDGSEIAFNSAKYKYITNLHVLLNVEGRETIERDIARFKNINEKNFIIVGILLPADTFHLDQTSLSSRENFYSHCDARYFRLYLISNGNNVDTLDGISRFRQ